MSATIDLRFVSRWSFLLFSSCAPCPLSAVGLRLAPGRQGATCRFFLVCFKSSHSTLSVFCFFVCPFFFCPTASGFVAPIQHLLPKSQASGPSDREQARLQDFGQVHFGRGVLQRQAENRPSGESAGNLEVPRSRFRELAEIVTTLGA